MTIQSKTQALLSAYQGQENLNYILKVLGTNEAYAVLDEVAPIPPLKVVSELGKNQLLLDKQDPNFLLAKSRYSKRKAVAQRILGEDATLQDLAYRLMVARFPVDISNSEEDLRGYIQSIVNDLAGVSTEEEEAIIPLDETLP